MGSVKFSAFADLHYRDGDWNWASRRLEGILARAEREQVDFIMHCGDFCHNVVTARPLIDRYNDFHIPTWHTMGNHDFEGTDGIQIVADAYKMKDGNYYKFDLNGIRMISLDTNYYHDATGKVNHYAFGSAWDKCHQGEQILAPEEEDFLVEALTSATGPCVIFSHASAIRPDGITNRKELQKKVYEASKGHPVLWLNGHYHRNNLQLRENVAYFDLNSTTSDWVEKPHNLNPPELLEKFPLANHVILFEDQVHAVITVTEDGVIDIQGMKGKMYRGIERKDTGNEEFDRAGLPVEPEVLSTRFKLLA